MKAILGKKGDYMDQEEQCRGFLNTLHQFKRMSCKLKPSSLPHGEFITLGAILHIGRKREKEGALVKGVKVSELAGVLHTSKPDVSKKIRTLEEKGLITRVPDVKDKRVVFLILTPEGEQIFEDAQRDSEQFIMDVFARMGKEEADEFILLLDKMVQAMKEEMEERNIIGKGEKQSEKDF